MNIINYMTYNGSIFDCIINYTVLVILCISMRDDWSRVTSCILIIFSSLQVIIWFMTNNPGISLIWCGLTGYYLSRNDPKQTVLALSSPFGSLLYYAFTQPLITSEAHFVAVTLGYFLSSINEYF